MHFDSPYIHTKYTKVLESGKRAHKLPKSIQHLGDMYYDFEIPRLQVFFLAVKLLNFRNYIISLYSLTYPHCNKWSNLDLSPFVLEIIISSISRIEEIRLRIELLHYNTRAHREIGPPTLRGSHIINSRLHYMDTEEKKR